MIDGRVRRLVVSGATAVALITLGAACGGDGGSSSPEVVLSPEGERGREIANSSGCAACHGNNGQGGSGPGWVGLADSMVELDDGSVVLADDAYLARAITDPAAEIRAGFSLRMPVNNLDDDEVQAVIAYIRDLSPEDADDGQ